MNDSVAYLYCGLNFMKIIFLEEDFVHKTLFSAISGALSPASSLLSKADRLFVLLQAFPMNLLHFF